jgi:hypothetical protein
VRVTQTLLRRLRTVDVLEHVVVHYRTEREVLQLLALAGVGKWQHQREEPGRWSVWRVE